MFSEYGMLNDLRRATSFSHPIRLTRLSGGRRRSTLIHSQTIGREGDWFSRPRLGRHRQAGTLELLPCCSFYGSSRKEVDPPVLFFFTLVDRDWSHKKNIRKYVADFSSRVQWPPVSSLSQRAPSFIRTIRFGQFDGF